MSKKLNILVIFAMEKYPMRATLWDQLYSFRNYSRHNCYYINLTVRRVPWYVHKIKFDLIVFGTIFLANRALNEWFRPLYEKARALKEFGAVKIAFPQDEHQQTTVLCEFIEELGIDHVYSVGPESEWPKIYETVDRTRVQFHNVLTGYLDEDTTSRIERLAATGKERNIDIGYRTWRAAPNLGRHGFLRQTIADLFQVRASRLGLVADISTRSEDTLWGDEWYKFLLRCKYTISVEGGATVLDREGKIAKKTEAFLKQHPNASFAEVEQACFAGLDGKLQYLALSPRHLEACATRTCQVLVAGSYNSVLVPGRHYIELKRDFSNINKVMETIRNDNLREEITERAYQEIVASRRYTYQKYVDFVLDTSLAVRSSEVTAASASPWETLCYYWMRASEFVSWVQVALRLYSLKERLKGVLRKCLVLLFSEKTVTALLQRVKHGRGERSVS